MTALRSDPPSSARSTGSTERRERRPVREGWMGAGTLSSAQFSSVVPDFRCCVLRLSAAQAAELLSVLGHAEDEALSRQRYQPQPAPHIHTRHNASGEDSDLMQSPAIIAQGCRKRADSFGSVTSQPVVRRMDATTSSGICRRNDTAAAHGVCESPITRVHSHRARRRARAMLTVGSSSCRASTNAAISAGEGEEEEEEDEDKSEEEAVAEMMEEDEVVPSIRCRLPP